MPGPRITYNESHPDVLKAKSLFEEIGSKKEVAHILGFSQSKIQRLLSVPSNSVEKVAELPTFPDEDITAEEILDHMDKRFQQRLKRDEAMQWFKVKVKDPKPVGIVFVGDPHIGSNGCNVSLLRDDVKIMAETEGLMCVNIGDTADNWPSGYLVRLYAENDVSRQTERRLARWFLEDAGIPWAVWLMGNHDTFDGEFSTYLKTLNAEKIPMMDWGAKFRLVFPNGSEVKISASHNHKGTSIYNPLHGQKREALWGQEADIIVAGHHHTWAMAQEEMEDGRIVTMARCRGYKWLDSYATTHGFKNKRHGASIMFCIDSSENNPTKRIKNFSNLEDGAEYLTWKRRQTK